MGKENRTIGKQGSQATNSSNDGAHSQADRRAGRVKRQAEYFLQAFSDSSDEWWEQAAEGDLKAIDAAIDELSKKKSKAISGRASTVPDALRWAQSLRPNEDERKRLVQNEALKRQQQETQRERLALEQTRLLEAELEAATIQRQQQEAHRLEKLNRQSAALRDVLTEYQATIESHLPRLSMIQPPIPGARHSRLLARQYPDQREQIIAYSQCQKLLVSLPALIAKIPGKLSSLDLRRLKGATPFIEHLRRQVESASRVLSVFD